MNKLKESLYDGVVIYSLLTGCLIIFMATNRYFLSFLERAAEMELNPLCVRDWIWALSTTLA